MPDTKITALAAITTVAPSNDLFPIVDVSDNSMAASGTTKNITVNQLLGAGGIAALSSATISGDLTVDTNTLKVNSSANRVGVVTTNLFKPLTVEAGSTAAGTINQGLVINSSANFGVGVGTSYSALVFGRNRSIDTASLEDVAQIFGGNDDESTSTSGALGFSTKAVSNVLTERYRVGGTGVHTWSNVGGGAGTAMTLNSTGLGVGAAPELKLRVDGPDAAPATSGSSTTNGAFRIGAVGASTNLCVDAGVSTAGGVYGWFQARSRGNYALNYDIVLNPNGGNVGIGVASPAFKLDVAGSAGSGIRFTGNSVQNVIGETGGNGLVGTVSNHNLGFYTNATLRALIDTSGNLLVGLTAAGTTAAKTIQIANGTAPTANVAGGQLYVEAGALKYRGSSGTVTTIANA